MFVKRLTVEKECDAIRTLLSEYLEENLAARQVWDVERHLNSCTSCSVEVRRLRSAIAVIRTAARHDTPQDFMAKLHSRLDAIEPERLAGPRLSTRLGDWAAGVRSSWNRNATPTFGLVMAVGCAAALFIMPLIPRTSPLTPAVRTVKEAPQVQHELDRHVADVAGDPLGDVAAAKLTAQLAPGDDGMGSEAE